MFESLQPAGPDSQMDNGETDGLLVARVRRGDSRAFDQLVRRHLRTAHAVARATLDNPDDADDVCQDAFIRALQQIDSCRNPERFKAWLMAIVRNTAHNRRQYNQVRTAVPLEKAVSAASGDDPLADAERIRVARPPYRSDDPFDGPAAEGPRPLRPGGLEPRRDRRPNWGSRPDPPVSTCTSPERRCVGFFRAPSRWGACDR